MKNLRNQAAQGVFWTSAQRWGRQAINLVILAVIARFVSPDEFGIVALTGTILEATTILLNSGLASAVVQKAELAEEDLDTVFWFNIVMGVLLAGLVILGSSGLADFFAEPRLEAVLMASALLILFNSVTKSQQAYLTRTFQFSKIAKRALVSTLVGGVAGMVLAVLGWGLWSLVARSLLAGLIDMLLISTVSNWRPRARFSMARLNAMRGFGVNVSAGRLLDFFRENIDNVLISSFLGVTALGYYSLGFKIMQILDRVAIESFEAVALPIFSRLNHDLDRLRSVFYQATRASSLVSFAAYIGVWLMAEPLVRVIYGDPYAPAVPVLRWLAVIGIMRTLFMFSRAILLAVGRPEWFLRTTLADTLLSTLGISIGVMFGIEQVAAGRAIASVLVMPLGLGLILVLIRSNWKSYLSQLRPALTGAAVMVLVVAGLIALLPEPGLLQLLICAPAGALVYLAWLTLFERQALLEVIDFGRQALPPRLSRWLGKGAQEPPAASDR